MVFLLVTLTAIACTNDTKNENLFVCKQHEYFGYKDSVGEKISLNDIRNNATHLEDLAYMHYVLQNNFPLLYTAYWGMALNINEVFAYLYGELHYGEEITDEEFFFLLSDSFAPMINIGHFGIHSFDFLPRQSYYIANSNDMYFEFPPTVSSSVIIDGQVAYLQASNFFNLEDWGEYLPNLIEFYTRIENYEHLIVDLRGNIGGWNRLFDEHILLPASSRERLAIEMYILFFNGDYSPPFASETFIGVMRSVPMGIRFIDREPMLLAHILQESYLPELRVSDREYYVLRAEYVFVSDAQVRNGLENINFNGKVWLLIDERVGSGAQIATFVAKESGFATLVGEPTWGNWGGFNAVIARMPNSHIRFRFDPGMVLNSRGYSIEAGIRPHHPNRPGMCALETTLALIAEGNY